MPSVFIYSSKGRRNVNEDVCDCCHMPDGRLALVVADGMGGYSHGDLAARVVADSVLSSLDLSAPGCEAAEVLALAFSRANASLRARRQAIGVADMGAVACAAVLDPARVTFAWVGDCRGCVFRGGESLCQTEDHAIRLGARRRRVVTRAVMGRPVADEVSVLSATLMPADVVTLCSDGLWGGVDVARLPADEGELRARLDDMAEQMSDNYSIIRVIV